MDPATGDWLSGYDAGGYYCELFGRVDAPATHTQPLRERLSRIPVDELRRRARNAENELFTSLMNPRRLDDSVSERMLAPLIQARGYTEHFIFGITGCSQNAFE
jgi:hypothetical protein